MPPCCSTVHVSTPDAACAFWPGSHVAALPERRPARSTLKEGMMKRILLSLVALLFSAMALAAVNLNTATKEELGALNGIGPVKAQAIIDYRKANGPFKSIEDVMKVKGIKEGEFGKIRGDISVSGATPSTGSAKAGASQKSAAAAPTAADDKAKKSAAIAADNEARAKGKEQRVAKASANEANAKGKEEKAASATAKQPMAKSSDASKSASTTKSATDKSKSTSDAAVANKEEAAGNAKK